MGYNCTRRQNFADCASHSILETRIRQAVLPPIQELLGRLKQEDVRTEVRAELVRQQEGALASTEHTKETQAETQKRLEARLTRLEDSYLDGDLSRDRYLVRRDEITAQLEELRAQFPEPPRLVLLDTNLVFAFADALEGEPPDDQEWREIIEGLVDRIVIEGAEGDGRKAPATINVVCKPEYEPMLAMAENAN